MQLGTRCSDGSCEAAEDLISGFSAIEAEAELIQVRLKLCAAAVISAEQERFQVADGFVQPMQVAGFILFRVQIHARQVLIASELETEVWKVPHAEKLLSIKGVGLVTVAGFLSEVGDIRRFNSPKQIQKLTGLELKENSSGKHRGRTSISKRGRKRLRKILFQVILPMIQNNAEFHEVYEYFTTRQKNPLKGKQVIIAAGCKLIRVFYAILKRGVAYDLQKLRMDRSRPESAAA